MSVCFAWKCENATELNTGMQFNCSCPEMKFRGHYSKAIFNSEFSPILLTVWPSYSSTSHHHPHAAEKDVSQQQLHVISHLINYYYYFILFITLYWEDKATYNQQRQHHRRRDCHVASPDRGDIGLLFEGVSGWVAMRTAILVAVFLLHCWSVQLDGWGRIAPG